MDIRLQLGRLENSGVQLHRRVPIDNNNLLYISESQKKGF